MGIIHVLDTELSNKIAAGEVVERPASVAKELVENSIDAGATTITVELNNGGVSYLRVTDNGKGMSREDAGICFLRHATSKIKTDEDLDAIYTLGFRGEALSSIGAVAQVSLYTKQKNGEGICVTCCGGEILSSEEAGIPDGTSVIVENLFYNTPARLKFLKKDATEAGYITDIITRCIFAHPEISFRLIVNGKEKLFSPGDSNLKNSVYTAYGKDYAKAMLEVDYEANGVHVTGLIGKGNVSRPNRNYQSFFVNKRYIKSPMIFRAVEDAYKNQIMIGKFPVAVLNIEINPSLMDINVHPTKLEVKFANEKDVRNAVYYGVKNALYALPNVPEITRVDEETGEILFERDTSREQLDLSEIAKSLPRDIKEYPKRESSVLSRPKNKLKLESDSDYGTSYIEKSSFKEQTQRGQENKTKERKDVQPEQKTVNAVRDSISRAFSDGLFDEAAKENESFLEYPKRIIENSAANDASFLTFNDVAANEETENIKQREELKNNRIIADVNTEPTLTSEKTVNKESVLNAENVVKTEKDVSTEPVLPTDKAVNSEVQVIKSSSAEITEPVNDEPANIFNEEYFRVVGQIFDTYVIVEKDNKMLLIDQHAAHERLMYEELKRDMARKQVMSQLLIEPVTVRLSSTEFAEFEECKDTLYDMGFECDVFGDSRVIIKGVPGELGAGEADELLVELITNSSKSKHELITEKYERMLYTIACKAAIKANHRLSIGEMEQLVKRVFALKNINTCPHGRPIVITMSKTEIEKEFKRIV